MACLAIGKEMPLCVRDAFGVVHFVRWSIGPRRGCFRLCDFSFDVYNKELSDEPRKGAESLIVYDTNFEFSE